MKKLLLSFIVTTFTVYTNSAQVTVNVPSTTWQGGFVSQVYEAGELQGTLTSIDVNVTLTASQGSAYADDFAVIVTTGLTADDIVYLQAGGLSDFGAMEQLEWPNGGSATAGTVCNGNAVLETPINFTANPNLQVWIGNGYIGTGSSGTWNGTFTLNGVSESLSNEKFASNALSVFPNPSNGIVNISNSENVLLNNVSVTDLNGRTVKNVQLNGATEAQINISDLSAGIYMMNISSDQGSVTKKIVKN